MEYILYVMNAIGMVRIIVLFVTIAVVVMLFWFFINRVR